MSHPASVIICYAKCYPCMFGDCPGGWHTWADSEDIEHALSLGNPDPSTSPCGCPCVKEPPRHDSEPPSLDESLDAPPCYVCGSAGACGYDDDGRPMIHAESEADDE